MPYIDSYRRWALECSNKPESAGELNFVITKHLVDYLGEDPSYYQFNEVIGVLECAKQEIYRRMIVPYEDKKMEENGDVYVTADNDLEEIV